MADVAFVRKEHLGSGNFEWTFRCQCDDGQSSTIKVTSGNQNEATNLAQLDCEAHCGEAKADSLRGEYAKLLRDIPPTRTLPSAFVVWVNQVNDEAYVVSLCSGDEIIVPREMVKSFRPLGRASSDGLAVSHLTARLEFYPDAPGALPVIQLARALERQLGSAAAAEASQKGGEVCQQVKVQVSGMACQTSFGYWTSAYPLTGALLARTESCQASNVTRIGQTQVRFVHTGFPGTPCQNNYSGYVYLDVCWMQPD